MKDRVRGIRLVVGLTFRTDPWRATLSLVLAVTEALGYALTAFGLKVLTDAVVHHDRHQAVVGAATVALLSGVWSGANLLGFSIRTRLRERMEAVLDLRVLELTMDVPGLEHLERPDYADRVALLRSQRVLLSSLNDAVVQNVALGVQGAAVLVLLGRVHPLLLALPLFGLPSLVLGARAGRVYQQAQAATAEDLRLRAHLFELATTAGPGKEIRVFGMEDELLRRFHAVSDEADATQTQADVRAGVLTAAGSVIFGSAFLAAIAFVAYMAVHGHHTTPGDLVLAVTLAGQLNSDVAGAATNLRLFARAARAAGHYLWLCDYARRAATPKGPGGPPPERLVSGIDFEAVGFRYPGTTVDVLEDVTFHLPAGATVAIVGDNGTGKSTLVKLLCRFYQPSTGRILVDGVDLQQIDIGSWRQRLSAAFQDAAHFELPAGEVVGIGLLSSMHDDHAVLEALDRAGATHVVEALPHGLATQLGRSFDDGVELSGGQWQMFALGRAMMRGAPLVLVLDEPTAALDAEAEHDLFDRYTRMARRAAAASGAVTLFVSHRFSTVRMADLIIVLDGGRIVEVGSHDELVENNRLYAELYGLQARGYR